MDHFFIPVTFTLTNPFIDGHHIYMSHDTRRLIRSRAISTMRIFHTGVYRYTKRYYDADLHLLFT